MATVEQAIAVKIRAFVEGLAQVQALSASVRNLNRPVGDGLSRTRKDVADLGVSSKTTVGNIATLISAMPRVAQGFANGTRSAKTFTAELGNVARELKPITDASRLLGQAKSIQLPRGFQGRVTGVETLKPLASSVTAPLVNDLDVVAAKFGKVTGASTTFAQSLNNLKQAVDAVDFDDPELDTFEKRLLRLDSILDTFVRKRRAGRASAADEDLLFRRAEALKFDADDVRIGLVEREALVDRVLPDDVAFKKRLVQLDAALDAHIRKQRAGRATEADTDILNRRAGLLGFSQTNVANRLRSRDALIPVAEIKEATTASRGLTQQFNTATSAVFRMRAAVALVAAAIGALAAAAGIYAVVAAIREVVQAGVQFNSTLENAKIGLAGIISNTFEIRDANGQLVTGIEAYQAGLGLAQGQMSKLRAATIETSFEFEDLLESLTNASSAVAGTNTSLEKTVDLVVKLSRVGSAINLTPSELSTQTGQVLRGATRVQTRLAQALFPGQNATEINKQIKAFRDAGTLAQELEERMAKFQFTANDIANTFTALANNAGDAFKLFAGEATLALFDGIKQALRTIIDQVVIINDEGVKLTPTFEKIANIFNIISGTIGQKLLGVVKDVFAAVSRWVGSFDASETRLRDIAEAAFEVGRQIVLWFGDALRFIGVLGEAGASANFILAILQATATFIATCRDVTRFWLGILQTIAFGPMTALLAAFEAIVTLIDKATFGLTKFGATVTGMRRLAQSLFLGGLSDVASGGTLTSTRETAGSFSSRGLRAEVGGSFEPGFSATPVRGTSTGEGGRDRAAKEALRARKQLLDALAQLQEASAKAELDLFKESTETLRQLNQQRYDDQLIAAEEFFIEKQKLDLADIEKEAEFLQKRQALLEASLRREVGNVFGVDSLDDDRLGALTAQANEIGAGGSVAGLDKRTADAVKLIFDYQKEIQEIVVERNKLDENGLRIKKQTTAELERQARANRQLLGNLNAELADSLGQGGVSGLNELSKRISDEFGKVLLETNTASPALKQIAADLRAAGNVSFERLVDTLTAAGIEVKSLSPETQRLLQLFQRLGAVGEFTKLSSEAEKIQQTLGFGVDGAFKGFDLGTPFDTALEAINALTLDALPQLQQKYEELVALTTAVSDDGTVLFTPEEIEFVNQLGLKVDELKNKIKALQLTRANSQNAEAIADQLIEDVQIRQTAGTINQIEAEEELIQIKRNLIAVYQQELATLLAINEAARSREQSLQILDLQNKIGELNNQINANAINLRDSITNSIGGAFENFFDAVLAGNESILTSFRRVIAQMLVEIGKAIFQALVLKQVMSLISSVVGGIAGGFGGGAGIGGHEGGHLGGGFGFAEGGYTGDGGKFEAAGIVHRGEHVMPANVVRKPGMLAYLESLRTGSFLPTFRGYAMGGAVATSGTPGAPAKAANNFRIINAWENSVIADWLNSSDGEQVIVNIVSKNRGLLGT